MTRERRVTLFLVLAVVGFAAFGWAAGQRDSTMIVGVAAYLVVLVFAWTHDWP